MREAKIDEYKMILSLLEEELDMLLFSFRGKGNELRIEKLKEDIENIKRRISIKRRAA
ncbi:hypothetical protein ABMA67_00550 [Halobacteriovorax sp. RZ-3]|uniref:hypothetical protein n=1 Tax=Halobacteriovorax sp. RZ-3 TaxID=3157720 RepID=UPI003723C742